MICSDLPARWRRAVVPGCAARGQSCALLQGGAGGHHGWSGGQRQGHGPSWGGGCGGARVSKVTASTSEYLRCTWEFQYHLPSMLGVHISYSISILLSGVFLIIRKKYAKK